MGETPPRPNLTIPDGLASPVELRRSIRRLGDFRSTVEFAFFQFNKRHGVELRIAPRNLTRAFLEWVRRFEAQRGLADRDRRDFSHFAAGLMLSSFIRNRPVELVRRRTAAAGSRPGEDALVDFWPEGVFSFEYCITVLDRVLVEQSLDGIHLSLQALELRSWQSFRENVTIDPDIAIPFLDLFLEGDPVWDFPTAARFRSALGGTLLGGGPRIASGGSASR